jgi:hypothetical protein
MVWAADMTHDVSRAHRRLAEAEHGVEQRMKDLADKMPDQERFEEAADSLSERADRHLATADAIEQHDRSD